MTDQPIAISYVDERGTPQIWAVSVDGAVRTPLTHGGEGSTLPCWSPDGTKIAFVAQKADGTSQVRVLLADGSSDRLVSDPAVPVNLLPRWTPDGRILYAAGTPKDFHVWVMTADGSWHAQLTFGGSIEYGATMGSMDTVTFASNKNGRSELWSWVDGALFRRTKSTVDATTSYPIEQKVPSVSPDGQTVAYWYGIEEDYLSEQVRGGGDPTPEDWHIIRSWQIWLMDIDGSDQRRLGPGDDPAWTPDGRIMHPTLPQYGLGEEIGVGVTNADGTGRRMLFTVPAPGPSGFSWRLR